MLELAGITRTALFSRAPSVKAIRFHDLRSAGITWMAIRGDDPLNVQQRAGQSSFSTTQIYVREADAIRSGFDEPFAHLPDGLLDLNRSGGEQFEPPEMTKAGVFCTGLSESLEREMGFEPTTPSLGSLCSTN
jgi:hypothetical protein